MANTKKQKGILLLDKQKLDCFVFPYSATVSFAIPQTVLRNMDIIDKNAFILSVREFIQKNKLPLSSFTLILHENVLFEKQFPTVTGHSEVKPPVQAHSQGSNPVQTGKAAAPPTPQPAMAVPPQTVKPVTTVQPYVSTQNLKEKTEKISLERQREDEEKEIQRFIDSVPFEEVSVTQLKTPTATTVIGTNKVLLLTLREAFEQDGSSIDTAVPATLFGKDVNLANGLTLEVARVLLQRSENIKGQNMLIEEKKLSDTAQGSVQLGLPQKDSEKKRLFAMAGVFGLLIIILVVLFMRMNAENAELAEKARQKKKTPAPVAALPTAVPTAETPVASSSAIDVSEITVQISANSSTASTAAEIRQILTGSGFKSITLQQVNITSSRTVILFSSDIPDALRETVVEVLSAIITDPGVQESTAADSSIRITL
jgi:hypothetical protein